MTRINLLDKVRQALRRKDRSELTAAAVAAGMSVDTVRRIKLGQTADPGFLKVLALAEWLDVK